MTDRSTTPVAPRWLHALAVLTVLFTLPLLFLGAGVTSHGVGMIDPRGFRPPWEIVSGLFENSGLAWRLEYGHRTFGFLVGLSGIAVAIGCWFCDRRAWLGWVAFVGLALICVQGALGILRVDRNAEYPHAFKLVHGCFAQIVFAVLVSIALFTSQGWMREPLHTSPALKRWSIVTCLAVFMQLILGGLLRHTEDLLGPRGHLLGAFVVVAAIAGLLILIRNNESRQRFSAARIMLMTLLGLQLLLGMESWLARFFVEGAVNHQAMTPIPMHFEWIRTAHYVVGSMIFATTVCVALLAHHQSIQAQEVVSQRSRELEGVS
jgi:cytochrome c oxidase assembly protein subunit 15